jgi:lipoate-protein ligase A
MQVKTILSFEDLLDTFEEFKEQNVSSYIGCCCDAFFTKHFEDFERSNLPGILIDINNTTCYDLGKEQDAYDGKFESQTEIDIDVLKMVLDAI